MNHLEADEVWADGTVHLHAPDAGTDEKRWRVYLDDGWNLVVETRTDAGGWGDKTIIARTGTTIDKP